MRGSYDDRLHQLRPGRPSVVAWNGMTISGRPTCLMTEQWTASDFSRAVPSPRKRLLTRRTLLCGAASRSRRDHDFMRKTTRARAGAAAGLNATAAAVPTRWSFGPQTPHFAARNIIQKRVPDVRERSKSKMAGCFSTIIRLIFCCPFSLGASGRGPHAAMKWNGVEERDRLALQGREREV